MSAEYAVRKLLAGNAGLAAVVGERVYWLMRPENDSFPAIVLQVVTATHFASLAGSDGVIHKRMQIDVYGTTWASVLSTSELVRGVLQNYRGVVSPADGDVKIDRIFWDDETDMVEQAYDASEAHFYRRSIDCTVAYTE